MYKGIIRPFLFLLKPEAVHSLVVKSIKIFFFIPFVKPIVRSVFGCKNPSKLKRNVFGLEFINPIGLAAGFDKNADLFQHFDAFGFSFIEVGTITPKAQPGNPKPRSFRLKKDKALINRMGFNNKGVDNAVNNLKGRKNPRIIIGGNIGKNTLTPNDKAHEDYLYCFKELYDHVDYFVVNVSCPNIKDLKQLQDSDNLSGILSEVTLYRSSQKQYKPILLKVSPDLTTEQLDSNIETAQQFNLDGFVATNTTTSRENLSTDKLTVETIANGGLSGEPLKNRSTEVIRYIHSKTKGSMPIIGVGGISSVEDALEKLDAGASLIQLYTGFIYEGPGIIKKICKAFDK
ncbi:MAG: quinone-dependent dihydroorotate dehydrogenase [Bacteroidales bacterium]|jgi:dihydroorotate dehydrogenase|nr:quinone-dependent dihydroorotate dehydrogenase [Bacteroidales bacterium]MDD4383648.1 quinone-dependent dihydroorotate dehydrogenase [Bacteroidales bacterium]MDY0197270.1 quinone-dependent dihydroorotate dehydrogenase [Tenuifilaceae bacterium]